MKNLFSSLLAIYNELYYNGICRRFQGVVEYLPELKGGIKILEIGFGKGTGKVNLISPYKVDNPLMFYENQSMYFAEVKSLAGEKGYIYALKENSFFIKLFYTGKKQEEVDFSFDPEGVITKSGKEKISLSTS